MQMLKELTKIIFKVAAVCLGLYLLLVYLPLPFDGRTSDEIAAEARFRQLQSSIAGMPKARVAFEVASALAYAEVCGFEVNENAPGDIFSAADFSPQEIDVKGVYKTDVEQAMERVIVATKAEKDEACRRAQSLYGQYGSQLPAMFR
ncbi:hypothetical protein EHS39_33055 [Ensifer sp. MPMI2T]|nr:hypothetical protein EHS39_33055 [Ensifer sp. MPMI2T]